MKILLVALCGCLMAFAACYRWNMEDAVESVMAIRDGQKAFKATHGRYGTLKELESSRLIESSLATGYSSGYKFTLTVTTDSYQARAVPAIYGSNAYRGTGYMSYFVDQSGVIRGRDKQGADADGSDPVLMRKDINPPAAGASNKT